MKVSAQTILLVYLSFFLNGSISAQAEISQADQKEIRQTCEIFFRQQGIVLTDYEAPTDSMFAIVSDPIKEITVAQRAYYQEMEFDDLEFPIPKILGISISDSIGCLVKSKPNFLLKTEKINGKWIIVGIDNEDIDQNRVNELKASYEAEINLNAEKDTIHTVLTDFVSAWSEMIEFGRRENLIAITTNVFFERMVQSSVLDSLMGYDEHGPLAVRKLRTVEISNDTAWCRVSIEGANIERFCLLKRNGTWLVAGGRGRVCTQEDLQKIRLKIENHYARKKSNESIAEFNKHLSHFFKTGHVGDLNNIATEKLIDQLTVYRNLCGTMDTNFVRVYGLDQLSFFKGGFTIKNDTVYRKMYSDSTRWIKKDGKLLLDDLFSGTKGINKFDKAHRTFKSFVKILSINYSKYFGMTDMELPPISPRESDQEVVYEPVHNHRLDNYPRGIEYRSGEEQLYTDVLNETKKYAERTDLDGVVYIEFEVDPIGKATTFRALNRPNSTEAKIAIDIASRLGDWTPHKSKHPTTTNMVVAIQF